MGHADRCWICGRRPSAWHDGRYLCKPCRRTPGHVVTVIERLKQELVNTRYVATMIGGIADQAPEEQERNKDPNNLTLLESCVLLAFGCPDVPVPGQYRWPDAEALAEYVDRCRKNREAGVPNLPGGKPKGRVDLTEVRLLPYG